MVTAGPSHAYHYYINLNASIFLPLLPPPPPPMKRQRKSRRIEAQPLILTYLKSVASYYFQIEEVIAEAHTLVSPPNVFSSRTQFVMRGLLRQMVDNWQLHPTFPQTFPLHYKSTTLGSSTLAHIVSARCPPIDRPSSQQQGFYKVLQVVKYPKWWSESDSGGFTVWHHLVCKARADVMWKLLKSLRDEEKQEVREGFQKNGIIDVGRGVGGGAVRYRKVLSNGGTPSKWAFHYYSIARPGAKGVEEWCWAMRRNFYKAYKLSLLMEEGKSLADNVKEGGEDGFDVGHWAAGVWMSEWAEIAKNAAAAS